MPRQTSAVKRILRGDQSNSSVGTPFWGMLCSSEAFSLTRKLTSLMNTRTRTFFLLLLASSGALAATPRHPESRPWVPDTLFAQVGAAEKATSAYTVGATWNWNWNRRYRFGLVTGYTEATVGRWETEDPGAGSNWFTQVGITPVLRLYPPIGDNRWFAEVGIGANYISPAYQTEGKRFSTEFNFGDHAAFGRILGDRRQASVALRIQHFSNGGIDAPNPGENFAQLRYSYQF
jgi:lipid A 3-O-deacylase